MILDYRQIGNNRARRHMELHLKQPVAYQNQ